MVRRCNKTLEEYEEKLHLVEKFTKIKGLLHDMKETEQLSEIHRIADEILEEL